jgi:hypothetical protein
MRYISKRIALLAPALMLLAAPVFAEEGAIDKMNELQGQQGGKDECLLVAKNCQADAIQERIERIKTEIDRGPSVYSNDELKTLNKELEYEMRNLDVLQMGG